MLIPLSWTVSEAVTMPERKRGKMGRGGGGKMERVCAEQRRRRVWRLMCSQSTTKTHGHDNRWHRQVLLSTLLLLHRMAISWPKWPQLPYSSIGLAGNESWMMEFRLWAGL